MDVPLSIEPPSTCNMREFFFHPFSDNLSPSERVVSLIANVALSILSLGVYSVVFLGVNAYDYWTGSTPRHVTHLNQDKSQKVDDFKEDEIKDDEKDLLPNDEKDLSATGVNRPITEQELAQHTAKDDPWIAIRGLVYNITPFLEEHPGGDDVLLDYAGKDATQMFEDIGHSPEAKEMMKEYCIGRLV